MDLVTILPIKPNGGSEMVVNLFFHSLNKYINQMGEPGGLPSMGASHRVGHVTEATEQQQQVP